MLKIRSSVSMLALAVLAACLMATGPAAATSSARGTALALGSGPGTISGTVGDDDGGPATGVVVRLLDRATGTWVPSGKRITDASGRYAFAGVDIGSYNVRFGPDSVNGDPPSGPYILAWNGGATSSALAAPLVISGEDHLAADATLAHGGTVTGQVRLSSGLPPFLPMTVRLYEDTTGFGRKVRTGAGGSYAFSSLPAGSYRLRVGDGIYVPPVWFGGTPDRASSTPLIVTAGEVTTGDVVIPNTGPPPPPPPDPWVVEPSADPPAAANRLNSISCTSTTWCMAVGWTIEATYHPLAEVWDGATWTVVGVPHVSAEDEFLRSVSCTGPSSCMAVGNSSVGGVYRTFAARWDGTAWSHTPTPNQSEYDQTLAGVSCAAADSCVAVGTALGDTRFPSVMAIWDGATWELVPGDDRGSWDAPHAVSCSSPTWCVAVGEVQGGDGTNGAEVQSWDGSSWSAMPGPAGPAAGAFALTGVDCQSASSCVAIGFWFDGTSYAVVVERWDGTAWTVSFAPPVPAGPYDQLHDISCSSATHCVAVGFRSTSPTFALAPLVEVWDGTSWQIAASPTPGIGYARLEAVSCVEGSMVCRAVGSTSLGGESTLVMRGSTG